MSEDLGSLRARASELQEEERWDEAALAVSRQILTLDPADVAAANRIARCRFVSGDFEGAARSFGEVLRSNPGNGVARNGLREALPWVEAESKIADPAASDLCGFGAELGKVGEFEQALHAYRCAIEKDPSAGARAVAYVGAAAVLRRLDRLPLAGRLCEEVLSRSPNEPHALNTLAAVRRDEGRLDEADVLFARARKASAGR